MTTSLRKCLQNQVCERLSQSVFANSNAGPPRSLRSRVPLAILDKAAEEFATPTRRFSLLEITSGLPDDSREADERAAERRVRDLRGRVKAARAVVATTPGLAETLARDWQKAARFYARFGISETQFRHGVRETARHDSDSFTGEARSRGHGQGRARLEE